MPPRASNLDRAEMLFWLPVRLRFLYFTPPPNLEQPPINTSGTSARPFKKDGMPTRSASSTTNPAHITTPSAMDFEQLGFYCPEQHPTQPTVNVVPDPWTLLCHLRINIEMASVIIDCRGAFLRTPLSFLGHLDVQHNGEAP